MKLKQRIGTMAVVLDEDLRVAEMVDVDTIAVVGLLINDRNAQIVLGFGGFDSTGKFHRDWKRQVDDAPMVIDREKQPDLFASTFCDAHGNLTWDYGKRFLERLCETFLVSAAHRMIWGAKYPDMEVTNGERVVFRTEKAEK